MMGKVLNFLAYLYRKSAATRTPPFQKSHRTDEHIFSAEDVGMMRGNDGTYHMTSDLSEEDRLRIVEREKKAP